MEITVGILKAICPATPLLTLEQFVGPLNKTFLEFDILRDECQQRFLAQVAYESQAFTRLEENLHYSAKGLAKTWGIRYATNPEAQGNDRVPNELARRLALVGPEAIANNVYANRMGNRDEASGDGWLNRGAGLIQTTGAENHAAVAAHFNLHAEDVGNWMRTPEGAARSAAFFWARNNLSAIENFDHLTERINGGHEGLAARYALLGLAKEAFREAVA